MTDPLLAALFDRLPASGERFDPFDRNRWLAALAACLDVVYGPQTRPAPPAAQQDPPEPRRGHVPRAVPCSRCGTPIGPQGMPAHLAMHRRQDEAAAIRQAQSVAAAPAADDTPDGAEADTPARPLTIAEPITRQPFDPDAARRRAAAAL